MKVAFDSSVLIPALVQAHPNHLRSIWWLREDAADLERIASWHAYAETWAVLTALPLEPRVSGEVARAALDRLRTRLRFVAPRTSTYTSAAQRCAERGLRSGAIYDALHLVTAEGEAADQLLTFNESDFLRLSAPDGPAIIVPPDPPGFPGNVSGDT